MIVRAQCYLTPLEIRELRFISIWLGVTSECPDCVFEAYGTQSPPILSDNALGKVLCLGADAR